MHPNYSYFPVHLLPTFLTSLTKRSTTITKKPNLCCSYSHWSVVKLPVSSFLEKTESSPAPPAPHQSSFILETYTSASLSRFSGVLLGGFLARLLLWDGAGGCGRSLLCLSFSTVSLQSWTALQRLPCPLQSGSGSADHRLARGIGQQHTPWTSAQPLSTACATNLSMVPRVSTGHRQQHDPRQNPGP